MATYDVIVGNIGTVRSEVSLMEARSVYRDYVHKSKAGEGRAAGESVTILNHETGEPDAEYEAPESGPAFDVYVGDINGICLKVGDAVNRVEARKIFQHYINRSKADYGEHAGKPVTITNTYTDSVVESYEPPKGFGEYDPAGSYKIVRMFERGGKRVIKRGLTLAEAQAWCKDPRTSSKTATDAKAAAYTRAHGPWFDGWEDDKKKLTSRQRQSHARHKCTFDGCLNDVPNGIGCYCTEHRSGLGLTGSAADAYPWAVDLLPDPSVVGAETRDVEATARSLVASWGLVATEAQLAALAYRVRECQLYCSGHS